MTTSFYLPSSGLFPNLLLFCGSSSKGSDYFRLEAQTSLLKVALPTEALKLSLQPKPHPELRVSFIFNLHCPANPTVISNYIVKLEYILRVSKRCLQNPIVEFIVGACLSRRLVNGNTKTCLIRILLRSPFASNLEFTPP